ncbi:hypothetical protein Droror1_Dr00010547 [Drosera rotundifolia]
MSPAKPLTTLLLTLTLILPLSTTTAPFAAGASDTDAVVDDLISLRSQSSKSAGVIRLTDHLLRRILGLPTPRPFSFLVFFDAVQLHDKAELNLQSLRSEFGLVSAAYLKHNDNDNDNDNLLFFFDIEFKDSQNSFVLFGVNSLPHIRLIGNDVREPKEAAQVDQGDLGRIAESIVGLIESKTGIKIGRIERPPLVSRTQMAVLVAVVLVLSPYLIKKVVAGETLLHDYKFWLFGAVFVYFFSVSGTMFNIIRKMPMFIPDRNEPGKLVFFYQGSGMQLGAEGFAVGFLYTVVGVVLALVTHGVVRIRNVNVQRTLMIAAMFVSVWAVRKVVYLDNWKTGYGVHGYWPTSWR